MKKTIALLLTLLAIAACSPFDQATRDRIERSHRCMFGGDCR